MAASSSSGVWKVQRSAGAAEPGAFSMVQNDETLLRVAFYNVGIQQQDLNTKKPRRAVERCQLLAHDIAEAFTKHRLDLLCLCELGEHEIGLHGRKNLNCQTQEDLLVLVTCMTNEELDGGAAEPAVQVQLVSGQYPTYAAMKRGRSTLEVEKILFHCGLDTRPGDRLDRTMLTLECRWMKEPIKITCCHCPSSDKRPWDLNVRESVLPNVFKRAGLVPFRAWRGGAAEPVAWILGGDLNLGENTIHNEMKQFQPPCGRERMVQVLDSGSLI